MVYVADSGNHRIQVFDANGNFLRKWGTTGAGDGQFNEPKGIEVDGYGRVYVADTFNHRVQVFDTMGNFLGKWGTNGGGDGEFLNPWEIEVDSDGRVYVADADNHRVQVFDTMGNFLGKWGSEGTGDGEFKVAIGIAVVEGSHTIYAVDHQGGQVHVFGFEPAPTPGSAGDVNGDGVAGFIVGARNADIFGVRAAGSAFVYSGADGSLLYQKNGAAENDDFGFSVSMLGDVNGDGRVEFIVGAQGADPGGQSSAGSAYVYSGADGSLLYRKDGAARNDFFGGSVATAGDVNGDGKADFIVGAQIDLLGLNPGRVYVYSGADGSLLYQKDAAAAFDEFGSSVSAAGDVNGDGKADFIVGANGTDAGGNQDAGSAYVYSGANGSLLYQRDGAVAFDQFGFSVSTAGDVNGDGKADFIVGAATASTGGKVSAGSAYVYSGADGSLLHQKDGAAAGDIFGVSVSTAWDVNGDGKADFIVGANGADPPPFGIFNAGSAYVYSGADGSLLHRTNGEGVGYHFGGSVSAGKIKPGPVDDVNGDGIADFTVGAPWASPGGREQAGSAYVYSGADGSLLYQKDGAATGDQLGTSVSIVGDVNRDGQADFIVGGVRAFGTGNASVYSGADGSVLYRKDGTATGDAFGSFVSGTGDVNRDGKADFIVGANSASPGGKEFAGSVYVYSGADGSLLYQKDGAAADDQFGVSVSGAGDVNGDGKADFIVGAIFASPGGKRFAGSAYVYSGADGSLLYQKDGAAADDQFGVSVSGAGDVNGDGKADFIVGAIFASPGGKRFAGSAYVYSGADGSLLYQKDGAATDDGLGGAVSGAGDVNRDGKADFIVGTEGADPGGKAGAGSAYVYSGADGSLLYQKDGAAADDVFGGVVASAGGG